jgi:hypothetical protein
MREAAAGRTLHTIRIISISIANHPVESQVRVDVVHSLGMTSMYSYPRVARCPPESIILPNCMYRVEPIAHQPLVVNNMLNGGTGDQNQDDRSLAHILSAQERLIQRIQRIEDEFVQLTGGPIPELPPHAQSAVAQVPQPVSSGQNDAAVESIIQRQEKLIQEIDKLSQSLQKSVTITPAKQAVSTPITRQLATDVSIFVEMGSSISQLYKFLQWLRDGKKLKVLLRTHRHSSTVGLNAPIEWNDFNSEEIYWRTEYDVTVTLIVTHSDGAKQQLRSFIDPAHGMVTGEDQIIRLVAEKLGVEYKP